jgi:hypothetical protein
MEKTQTYPIKAVVILLMVGILTAQCASSATVRTGVFPDTSRITADLKRGSSSKLDVKQILGVPKVHYYPLIIAQKRSGFMMTWKSQALFRDTALFRSI